jgi:hypothetical protein
MKCKDNNLNIGWETWITDSYWDLDGGVATLGNSICDIHPEDNKYGINFPNSHFEIIDERVTGKKSDIYYEIY